MSVNFKKKSSLGYKVEVLTGIRPTGNLHVANYLGAVAPIIQMQEQGLSPVVFIADLHAMTDSEPKTIKGYVNGLVADYLALGVDPQKTKIYVQSVIGEELGLLTSLFTRHISIAELLRVPTLKDKLKAKERPETANTFLCLYPVLMAADILINRSRKVPVGEDQVAHLEVTRLLAKRFNKRYGETFPLPEVLQVKSLRLLSLKGEGKMSKTNPQGALFLTDSPEVVAKKIKTAETGFAGKMNERIKSYVLIAQGLAQNKAEEQKIKKIISQHQAGQAVMGEFKKVFTDIVQNFLKGFQVKRDKIIKDQSFINEVLKQGAKIAQENARETLGEVKKIFKI